MSAVQISGISDTQREIEEIKARMNDLTPVLQVLAQDMRTLIDDSFDKSQAPDGEAWLPLKPATIAKRRLGSSKPLVDTGRLRNSIAVEGRNRYVKIGSNVEYAAIQQFGGRVGKRRSRRRRLVAAVGGGGIPARPYIPVDAQGDFMQGGAADTWMADAVVAIAVYITTGEISG